jgi:uncharacterized protein (UPF0276 family)
MLSQTKNDAEIYDLHTHKLIKTKEKHVCQQFTSVQDNLLLESVIMY